eukprot:3355981-Prymnesium_polylepis.2
MHLQTERRAQHATPEIITLPPHGQTLTDTYFLPRPKMQERCSAGSHIMRVPTLGAAIVGARRIVDSGSAPHRTETPRDESPSPGCTTLVV